MRSSDMHSFQLNHFLFCTLSLIFDLLIAIVPINFVCIYHYGNMHEENYFGEYSQTSGNRGKEYAIF